MCSSVAGDMMLTLTSGGCPVVSPSFLNASQPSQPSSHVYCDRIIRSQILSRSYKQLDPQHRCHLISPPLQTSLSLSLRQTLVHLRRSARPSILPSMWYYQLTECPAERWCALSNLNIYISTSSELGKCDTFTQYAFKNERTEYR